MLFVVSGPSGCGKSTLIARVRAALPGLRFSVSHTTRPPRAGEADGREYHFVTEAEFRRLLRRRAFLEHAEVHGHLYGTSRREAAAGAAGEDVLLDIDVQGALQVRASGRPAVLVFVLPPSRAALEARLRGRALDAPEAVATRLRNAAGEVRRAGRFDYAVVNDDLERAAEELRSIFVAERCRAGARRARIAEVARTFPPAGPRRPGRAS